MSPMPVKSSERVVSMLRRKLEARIVRIKAAINVSDDSFGRGDYAEAAKYAAFARDAAEAIYADCYGLALSLDEEGYGACAAWYDYAEETGLLLDTACAMIVDCERYLV